MKSAIAAIKPKWVVQVVFESPIAAREFAQHLEKVKTAPCPLYSALLASSLKPAEAIEITKENRAP